MTRPGWKLVCILARVVDPVERDVVLGDVAESGEGLVEAVCDLLSLILRRQAGLWTTWRPWLALVGVCCVAGVPLSRIAFGLDVDLGLQIMAYQKYGAHFGTGLTLQQDIAYLLCRTVALLFWSLTCGFVLGSLSGRTAWLTWLVFYVVVLDSAWAKFVVSGSIILRNPRPLPLFLEAVQPLRIETLLFALPALCGSLWGLRRRTLTRRAAYLLATAVTILATLTTWASGWQDHAREIWSDGAWRGLSWPARLVPFALASWPTLWLLLTSYRQERRSEKETV